MSGRLGDLSAEQNDKLTKFKELIKDVRQERHDDKLLLRFLRARNFDLGLTELMFREDIDWRKSMQSDSILTDWEMPEVLEKCWGGGIVGDDREGRPVFMDPNGNRDIKGLMHSATQRDIMKLYIKWCEIYEQRIHENSIKLGKDVDGVIIVTDMTGMNEEQGLWKPGIDFGKQILSMFQLHYPELMRKIIIINSPKIFYLLWAAVKPFIREETRRKMSILGTNYLEELLKEVPPEILPVHYGGTLKDETGDPKCPSIVKPALKVAESYYLKGRVISSNTLINKVIDAGVKLEFQYKVNRPDSLLLYEFKTKEHDIAFSVKRLDEETKKTSTVLEKRRYHCYLGVPEDGRLILSQPGLYIVKFDNSYSLMKKKYLDYWIEVLEPLYENEEVGFQEPVKFDPKKES